MHVTPDVYAPSPNVGGEALSTECWVILVLAQLLHQIRMAHSFNSQLEPVEAGPRTGSTHWPPLRQYATWWAFEMTPGFLPDPIRNLPDKWMLWMA